MGQFWMLEQVAIAQNGIKDQPNYPTQLECCRAAYGGQSSGTCLAELPSPPSTSPTGSGGADYWFADYESRWDNAKCLNKLPFPGGRPIYSTYSACCSGAYGGQVSHACICGEDNPNPSSVCFTTQTTTVTTIMVLTDITIPSNSNAFR
eukprot:CAMPEP_0172323656 /NCGR_PEP_ID=MMETSP1058-20130122/49347_1 /TAXON_ID=83371 /ORGANISM="Detonula confervacea, Strain CCMP 353" /LENGTH=148 /DNA_ID=CAMNT_0013039719 /DNA_START=246 /DNA_END=690 /DNA_ORIENTATION=+